MFRLSLIDAVDTPLFHNAELRKRISLSDARVIVDWMARSEEEGGGGRRAEWVPPGGPGVAAMTSFGLDGGGGGSSSAGVVDAKTVAWIWWRRPEEWATLLADWVGFIRTLTMTVFHHILRAG